MQVIIDHYLTEGKSTANKTFKRKKLRKKITKIFVTSEMKNASNSQGKNKT
jgi:hypothetical protein